MFTFYLAVNLTSSSHGQGISSITTETLSPSKDAFVAWKATDGSWANTNYGTNAQLNALAGTHSGAATLYRSFVGFDLSVIPSNAIIIDATLYLYSYGDHAQTSGSNESMLHALTASWSESTITWNNQPGFTVASGDPVLPASTVSGSNDPNLDYVVDVTAFLKAQRSTGTFEFAMKLATESGYRKLRFWSKEYGTSAERPKLVITYINQTIEARKDETGTPIYINGDVLPFKYHTEEIADVSWKVYDETRQVIFSASETSASGDNYGVVDLRNSTTYPRSKRYTLEILSTRKEYYYIQFFLID